MQFRIQNPSGLAGQIVKAGNLEELGTNDLFVNDLKRRRTEKPNLDEPNEISEGDRDTIMNTQELVLLDQKNLLMVGTAT